MRIPSGVTDQVIYFVAVDATDFTTRETGLATWTVVRSRNGAADATFTTPTVAEIDNTTMPGVYSLLLDEDMTIAAGNDSEEFCVHITHTGMAPVTRTFELYREKITQGETLTVTSSALGANTITATSIATGAIDADAIATDALGALELADGSITAATFAAGAIDATAIANGAIDAATFAAGAIDAAAIATGAIDADALAADAGTELGTAVWATTTRTLSAGAVTTATFAAGAIDAAAIAANAITSSEFADGTITAAKFAAGAITAAVIATDAIDDDAIATGAIASTAFAAGAITAAAIATDAIDDDAIATGAIASTAFASGAITAAAIAADAIGASELAADAATEIGTAVWATATRSLTVFDEDSTTLDLDTTIRAAVGLASANLDTQLDALPTAPEAFAAVLTTQLTQSYAADGAAPTLAQAIFMIQQMLGDFEITGTTLTVKQLNGTSTAATFTLDSATTPTSITRAT